MAKTKEQCELAGTPYRPVYYRGKKAKKMIPFLDPKLHTNKSIDEVSADIIVLFTGCSMGYSPIRHILGLKDDHFIEDVIRQHRLGRKGVTDDRVLICPGHKSISDRWINVLTYLATKYQTLDDPYILEMFSSKKWYDDPVSAKNVCNRCGNSLESDWICCPVCGEPK